LRHIIFRNCLYEKTPAGGEKPPKNGGKTKKSLRGGQLPERNVNEKKFLWGWRLSRKK